MRAHELHSIPGVAEIIRFRGTEASAEQAPALLIEVPHGATRASEFQELRALLRGDLPEGLADFFFVNTDAGAPELAVAVAERLVSLLPQRQVLVLRSRIPRTFIDCNRVIDLPPEAYKAGKVTAGLAPYVRDPADQSLLRARYDAWLGLTDAAHALVCEAGGLALHLHTYAPRSVDVEVDDQVGPNLRAAYQPELYHSWPLRPEVDLIVKRADGSLAIPHVRLDGLRETLEAVGLGVAVGETYPLHPSTLAARRAERWPGQVLCVEVRRDLLAEPFSPFEEMHIAPEKAARIAEPLADALRTWLKQ